MLKYLLLTRRRAETSRNVWVDIVPIVEYTRIIEKLSVLIKKMRTV